MRLLITGGGTGGHVYPLIAVLSSLVADARDLNLKSDVLYVGRESSIEQGLAEKTGIRFSPLRVGGIRSLAPTLAGRNLVLLARATLLSRRILREFKPDVIFATGGYVSAPVIWAAGQLRMPVVIYLPDLEPGWAIQVLWRWSRKVAVSFAQVLKFFPKGRAVVTGYPVRAEFYRATREAGRAHFELDGAQEVITVFGGSQGAHVINETVRTNLKELLAATQIIHISGKLDADILQQARAALEAPLRSRYHLFSYLENDMPLALAAADIVIARAGAATLGEFPAVGVPSILIPGTFAQGHQSKNAEFLASRGAAINFAEARLASDFVPTIKQLLADRVRLEKMASAMRGLAQPNAARNIANLLQQVAVSV